MKRSVGQPTFGVVVDNEHGAGYRWFLRARAHHYRGPFWWCFGCGGHSQKILTGCSSSSGFGWFCQEQSSSQSSMFTCSVFLEA